MNNHQKKQLDRYSMMIVSKYFKSIGDFIKLIQICKKYQEIPEMFHYNPVPLKKKIKLFPNIETYHVYNKKEKRIEGYERYVYWNIANYDTFLKKKENEEFKNVQFTLDDWNKYNSFEGANTLAGSSMSLCKSIEIDLSRITKLEKNCFIGNQQVRHIKLDKRITTIPDNCFSGCSSLVEFDLSYVKILGNNCFYGCSSLTSLTLPETLNNIGEDCFYGLNELEKIETKGIKLIKSNMSYSLYNSFKRNGIDVKGDISYNNYDRTKYGNQIPEEISVINNYCFYYNEPFGDVILPTSVTRLEQYSFNNCSLKSINLSQVIRNNCYFSGCNQITSITLSKNNLIKSENVSLQFYHYLTSLKNIELTDTNHIPIVSNHLRKLITEKGYHYDKCIYMQEDLIETNYSIPEEVNIIGIEVFYRLNLKTIIIPSNVTHIFTNNFNSLSISEGIEIQSTNIQCDGNCFSSIPNVKELDLRVITSFGNNCICNCSSLTKLIIQNVPMEYGLVGCDSLKEIEIIGIENNEYQHPINYKVANLLESKGIHCQKKLYYKYRPTNNEKTYCIPDGVNEIVSYAFNYSLLKEITIPSSVTLINAYAFYGCYNLTQVTIEGNKEDEVICQIRKNAFYGCSQIIQSQFEKYNN